MLDERKLSDDDRKYMICTGYCAPNVSVETLDEALRGGVEIPSQEISIPQGICKSFSDAIKVVLTLYESVLHL